jgi:hypothetical protein
LQHRDETERADKEQKQAVQERDEERKRQDLTERREALRQIYTRYLLAADRLENTIPELMENRHPENLERHASAFETAQREYDEVCEILKLAAPSKTVEVALQQRQLFNRFAREALDGSYDHNASKELMAGPAQRVFAAMRLDLGSPE